MHSLCWPELAIPGQDIETTGPALRLVVSVCALLWGRSPWGRASLRLKEPCHFETQCMMGFSALPPYVDNHLLSTLPSFREPRIIGNTAGAAWLTAWGKCFQITENSPVTSNTWSEKLLICLGKPPFFVTAPFSHNTTRSDFIEGGGLLTVRRVRHITSPS